MKEAFDRALRANPQTPVRRVIEGLERDRMLAELGDKLYLLGEQWYALKVSRVGFAGLSKNGVLEELRRIWRKRAILWEREGEKVLRRKGERAELLSRLADGIWYSDAHQAIAHSLLPFRITTLEEDSTFASRLFIEGFSDLSGCSVEEDSDLREFVHKTTGPGEEMELPKVIDSVAVWMGTKLSWIVAPTYEY